MWSKNICVLPNVKWWWHLHRMKSRDKVCLPRAVWFRGCHGAHPGGLDIPTFRAQVSPGAGHYPWGTAISRVSMVASPSAKGLGHQHNKRGQMQWLGRIVKKSWVVQALEIPENAGRPRVLKDKPKNVRLALSPILSPATNNSSSFFASNTSTPRSIWGVTKKLPFFSIWEREWESKIDWLWRSLEIWPCELGKVCSHVSPLSLCFLLCCGARILDFPIPFSMKLLRSMVSSK